MTWIGRLPAARVHRESAVRRWGVRAPRLRRRYARWRQALEQYRGRRPRAPPRPVFAPHSTHSIAPTLALCVTNYTANLRVHLLRILEARTGVEPGAPSLSEAERLAAFERAFWVRFTALPAKSLKPVHNRRPYAFRARRRPGRGSPGGRRCAKEDEPGRSPARGAGGRLREYRARARCASCWVFGA